MGIIHKIKNFILITISTFIIAVGIYFFKFPNNFSFGGITGFAVVVADIFPISAGDFTFVGNMLLLLIGFIFLGKSFAIKTGYSSILLSLLLILFEHIYPMTHPLSNERMLELIFAIALPAIGSALLFYVHASSGGTDVIAMMLKKYTQMKDIGLALFATDLIAIIVACFVFDIKTALYSFVGLTIKSLMIDRIIESINMSKSITIICDDAVPICNFITQYLKKSATVLKGMGAYAHTEKYVIFTTLTPSQANTLRSFLHKHSAHAFISVSSTSEVFGKGFASIDE